MEKGEALRYVRFLGEHPLVKALAYQEPLNERLFYQVLSSDTDSLSAVHTVAGDTQMWVGESRVSTVSLRRVVDNDLIRLEKGGDRWYDTFMQKLGVYSSSRVVRQLQAERELVDMMRDVWEDTSLVGKLVRWDEGQIMTRPLIVIPDGDYGKIMDFEHTAAVFEKEKRGLVRRRVRITSDEYYGQSLTVQ